MIEIKWYHLYIKTTSILIAVAVFVGYILLSYIFACLALYAFVGLTGLLEFTWLKAFWLWLLLLLLQLYLGGIPISKKEEE